MKVLKDDLIISIPNNTTGADPNNPIVKWTYKISVDDNNNYIVQLKSAESKNGQSVPVTGSTTVWKNDGYTPLIDTLKLNGLTETALNKTVYQELQTAAQKHSKVSQTPLPAWAKTTLGKNQAAPPSQSAAATPPTPATAVTQQPNVTGGSAGNIITNFTNLANQIKDTFELITNPIEAIDGVVKDKFGGDEGGNYQNNTQLVYPVELKGNLQRQADVLLIQQFEYIPANKDEFLNPNANNNIFEFGLSNPDDRFNNIKLVGGSVTLPMPQSFSERKAVQFGEDTMNTLAAGLTQDVLKNMGGPTGYMAAALGGAAAGTAGNLLSGSAPGVTLAGFGGMAKFGIGARAIAGASQMLGKDNNSGKALLSTTVSSLMLKAAGMNVSAETILARGAGIVPNPNMELLFRSPELRRFGFAYRLTARSKGEAEEIRKIIRFFKQGMSPKRQSGKQNYFLKTPNIFRVQFKTVGSTPNKAMPKFKSCALKGFETDYSPDQMWAAYEDGQPVSVNIMMEFGELTPIYANDYDKLPVDDIGF